MRKIFNLLTLIIILALIVNCKDKENHAEDENDDFYYENYKPAIEVHCCDTVYIDLNNDNIKDIGTFIHDPVARIISLNPNTFFFYGTQHSGSILPVQENDFIDNRMDWENDSQLRLGLLGAEYETYIAFKFIEENDSFYGWIKVTFSEETLYIDEYGYNKKANEPILAGQLLSY